MITKPHINKIIIGVVVIMFAVAGIIMLNPQILGIQTDSSSPQYADKLFPEDAVITIDITADEDQWNEMLENATDEEYISCDLTINGEKFTSVGIRPKGNSSLTMVAKDDDSDRFSFKIKMDEYVEGQTYYGLSKFVVNNMQGDATYMKEYLSYDMFKTLGVSTPLYSFADISLNGEPWGFYLAVEVVEEEFAQRNYGTDYGMLYKPESQDIGGGGKDMAPERENQKGGTGEGMPQGRPDNASVGAIDMEGPPDQRPENASKGAMGFGGPDNTSGGAMNTDREPPAGFGGGGNFGGGASSGAGLVYTDDEIESYPQIFDNAVFDADDADKNRIITALKALASGENLEQYVDTDEVLRYFAANTALVNLDSYICSFQHNYYLYEEEGKISILPWDLNLSFGGFQSKDASTAVNFPIDTPVAGVELSQRPLIGNLLENEEYKALYHEYLQQVVDEYFNSGHFEETIDELDALIGEHVKNDPSAFFTYDQYQAAIETLKDFGTLRADSLQGQLDGTVPATSEEQTASPDLLIDASGITMSTMGTQGNGGGFDKGN